MITDQSSNNKNFSSRLTELSFIASQAGYNNPDLVALNADTLSRSTGVSSPESFGFEPTRHNEGFRRALWTLNNYKLSINGGVGAFGSTVDVRKDWEISSHEKKIAGLCLRQCKNNEEQRRLPGVNDDLVTMYKNEISKIPRLSAYEEVDLAKNIEAGLYACHKLERGRANFGKRLLDNESLQYIELALLGKSSFDRFYCANLALVISVAKRYSGLSMPFIDVIQEGNLGLWHAIEKFDYKKGYKFSTYATKWINQSIIHNLSLQKSGVPMSEHGASILRKLREECDRSEIYDGKIPSVADLSQNTGIKESVVRTYLAFLKEPLSIDISAETIHNESSGRPASASGPTRYNPIDYISEGPEKSPEQIITKRDIYTRLGCVIDSLEPTERQAIIRRFGLGDGRIAKLEEIAEILGTKRKNTTSMRISKILEKMRSTSINEGLEASDMI